VISGKTLPVGMVVHQMGQWYRTMFHLIVVYFTLEHGNLRNRNWPRPRDIDARSSAWLEEVVGVGHDALQVFIAARAERWIMSIMTIKKRCGAL
jgi:hypothetical protein